MTYYFIQSKKDNDAPKIVGHSTDEETGEINYKFIEKKKARQLIDDEKKSVPDLKYRLVKIIQRIEHGKWE